MKQIAYHFLAAFAATALLSCGGNQQKQNAAPDVHTSKNSLTWTGTYEGIFPCADCPGIYVQLALDENGNYQMYEKYIERTSVFVSKGAFEWNAAEDSVRLLTDGNMAFRVGENELSAGDYRLARVSDGQKLADSYTKQLIKEDESGEDVAVEIYFENDATVAQFAFAGKTYKLKENREIGQEQLFTDGTATLVWNIIDPAPQPDFKPVLETDGKKYTFTRLTPTNYLYVTDDAAAPVKGFDVQYFNMEEGKSFVQLLASDIAHCYALPQTEASAKTAEYEKDGVKWATDNQNNARLTVGGKEYRYKQTQMTR